MKRTPEALAARKEARRIVLLPSVARHCKVVRGSEIEVTVDGVSFFGMVEEMNAVLLKLGYKPVRITSNLLNPGGGKFAIDADTPVYLDPGCESYHSM